MIVPGKQIGKVRIGMTFAQVEGVLGRPNVINRSQRTAFGRYVEYDWGWGRWTVGFSGRGGALRVTVVATTLRRERTREGIGVGSVRDRVVRSYGSRGLRCPREYNWNRATACRLPTRTGATTYFAVQISCVVDVPPGVCPTSQQRLVVYEVLIRTAAAPRPAYHG